MNIAVGFNAGQFGDLAMNVVACRALKEKAPDCTMVFGMAQKFCAIKDLFLRNPLIDDIIVWEGYDEWPTPNDEKLCRDISRNNKAWIFNAMPKHTSDNWWKTRHQVEELCAMHGLPIPENKRITLNKYWKPYPLYKTIAIAPFGGYGAAHKSLSVEKAQAIVDYCRKQGYAVIQIGHSSEPALQRVIRPNSSFVDSVKLITECALLITVDTGMAWIASGYEQPTVGLYSNEYYGADRVCAIQPFNGNARYLDAKHCNDIPNEKIFEIIYEKIRH